ncbi:MAG: archease [Burkholderiales bacterium]
MAKRWEHFRHEADIGVRGYGPTLAEAFEQVALAMTAVITEPASVGRRERVEIVCENNDPEFLLIDWLNSIIFEMATRHLLFGDFKVSIADGQLSAVALGEGVDVARHKPAVEVKGATLTELRVAREASGEWLTQCVVDV